MRDSVKKLAAMLLGWTVAVYGFAYFFELFFAGALGLYLSGTVAVSVIWYSGIRRKRSETAFYDMTEYLEQLLCSYGREKTILDCLGDCLVLFPEKSPMRKVLKRAVYKLRSGEGNEDESVLSASFQSIYEKYPNKRLRLVHTFIENVSQMGGEYKESLEILLRDLHLWKQRVILHQKKKQTICQEGTLYLFLAVLLCYLSRILMPDSIIKSLICSVWYQSSTVLTGILLLLGEAAFCLYLSGNWFETLKNKSKKKWKQLQRNYDYVMKHSSGIRFYQAKQVCRQEIEKEFPYWILTVTLYLQEDSVYQSILHSLVGQENFFKHEIEQLLMRIYDHPDDIQSYSKFCEFADIPELHTIMKLLYAVNINGVQDTKRQVLFLVEQNSFIVNQTEEIRLSHKLSVVELFKQFPMVIGGLKVVFDLLLFLVISMRNMQNFL